LEELEGREEGQIQRRSGAKAIKYQGSVELWLSVVIYGTNKKFLNLENWDIQLWSYIGNNF